MKKSKLNLKDLKVTSFVTDMDKSNTDTVKGGGNGLTGYYCDSEAGGYCWSQKCHTYNNNCTAVNCGSANPC